MGDSSEENSFPAPENKILKELGLGLYPKRYLNETKKGSKELEEYLEDVERTLLWICTNSLKPIEKDQKPHLFASDELLFSSLGKSF